MLINAGYPSDYPSVCRVMHVLRPALLFILATTVGCAHAGGSSESSGSAEEIRLEEATTADAKAITIRGVEVYLQQYCGTCHRFDRAETSGIFGPPHDDFAVIAEQRIREDAYTGHATTTAEYVRESIVDPDIYVVPGYAGGWHRMPPYLDLAPEDLEALVQLLLSGE